MVLIPILVMKDLPHSVKELMPLEEIELPPMKMIDISNVMNTEMKLTPK